MKHYLLVDSRDPFEDGDGHWYRTLARDLKAAGNTVSLFLVENGVFAAGKRARSGVLDLLTQGDVKIRVDDFSLRERGIRSGDLAPRIAPSRIDYIIEQMESGATVMWR